MRLKIIILLVSFTAVSVNAFSQSDTLINQTDQQGRKQGHWIKKYPNKKIMYDGVFRDNHPIGEFRRFSDDGKLQSVLIFSKDGKEANATIYHQNGKVSSIGKYVNEQKEGKWQFFSAEIPDYLICEEYYSGNKRNGLSVKFYPDSTVAEKVSYINDLKNGEWIQYYPNGKVCQISYYRKGKAEGKFEAWYDDGKVQITGQYINDQKEGKWLIYKDDGAVKYELNYENGLPSDKQLELDETNYIDSLERNKGKIPDPEKTGIIK
jgi:antitoxin component YwqK of YwqJK toxin-antitoxin module